jgi:N-acetyl-beta-hexosaminidase
VSYKIFDEFVTLFDNPEVHVGGDEPAGGGKWWVPWIRSLDPSDVPERLSTALKEAGVHSPQYADASAIYRYFMVRVRDMLISRGRRMIAWEELLGNDAWPRR